MVSLLLIVRVVTVRICIGVVENVSDCILVQPGHHSGSSGAPGSGAYDGWEGSGLGRHGHTRKHG